MASSSSTDSSKSFGATLSRNSTTDFNAEWRSTKRLISKTDFYRILPRVPRILKADERRNYGFIFVNALNSGDWYSIYNCFASFCSPSFCAFYSTRLPGLDMPVPKTLEFRNIQETCEFIFLRSLLSPDNTWQPFDNMQLRVSSSGHSVLEFDLDLVFTFLHGGDIVQQILSTPSAQLFPATASLTGYEPAAYHAASKFAIIEAHVLQQQGGDVVLMPFRAQNKMIVRSRIHINPEYEVERIEYIYTFASAC